MSNIYKRYVKVIFKAFQWEFRTNLNLQDNIEKKNWMIQMKDMYQKQN